MILHQSRLLLAIACALTSFTCFSAVAADAEQRGGVLPVGADGKPLNLDFETGTLQDWKVEGAAFSGQPIEGDAVAARRNDMKSDHQGKFWIGGFERHGDAPQGTLTSAPFKVTHPFASFLVAGGPHRETSVEVVRAKDGKIYFHVPGPEAENLQPVAVDLQPLKGEEIFIRLVDRHGGHWGHLNFDDFRFHDSRPVFPESRVSSTDVYEHAGLSPDDAANVMTMPEGFSVIAAAGEPDIHQPIAMALDDRGRLWIAEAYEYPRRAKDGQGRDRILILEDADGDGRLEKRKVFAEGLNLVSGIELGFGGVFVGAAPYLLFIADEDGDDKADGTPEVLLDGWAYEDTHETLNTFIWGPDGWLYGCHGVFTHSNVGKPGAPNTERERINAGIWRYHPTKREFEVFAHGTSNPWGVDFDDRGQAFATACVIPHLYHVIQGGRYQRQAGNHFNPYTYDDIKTIALHRHYVGNNPHAGNNRSDSAGGGHAHAGAMVYLGASWPDKYRNQIFMNNIHGQRINMDQLALRGSGYVGDRAPDFLFTNDLWSQILNLRYGPDGQVYMIDWYDENACHHNKVDGHDRTNGRVFKVVYNNAKAVQVDLQKLSDAELVKLQLEPNDWFVRHSRRILQERAAAGKVDLKALEPLTRMALEHADESRRLRALWTLQVTGVLDEGFTAKALQNDNALVRSWTIQFLIENTGGRLPPATLSRLAEMAANDPSQVVRLYLSSALQRMPNEDRWEILSSLLGHAEDAGDHNLPLMYWYAMEPLCEEDLGRALALGSAHRKIHPQLHAFIVRRIGSSSDPQSLAKLVEALLITKEPSEQLALLDGLNQALKGTRRIEAPARWNDAYARLKAASDPLVRLQATVLAATFGNEPAQVLLRAMAEDSKLDLPIREDALAAVLRFRGTGLSDLLETLLVDMDMRPAVLRSMAAVEDSSIPKAIVAVYPMLSLDERRAALATLASRVSYAESLLAAVEAKQIPSGDLSADLVRQLTNLDSEAIADRVKEVWGNVRETSADKAEQIARYKALLTSNDNIKPDLSQGRAVFAKTCQQCHTLFGEGAKVGPELTGSNRANLDYVLSNVLDPSAVMAKEYMPSIIRLEDGRIITGIIRSETKKSLSVQTATELLTVARDEVDAMKQSDQSMMPDDILTPLSDAEVRSLVAYLASPAQVPLPETDTATAALAVPDGNKQAKRAGKISFKKTELDRRFRSEGVAVADFNGDGKTDIAAGSVWYEAPDWKMHSILEKPMEYDPMGYSNSFVNFADDRNGDGKMDLMVVDFPGQQTWWFENPGETGKPWKRSVCTPVSNNESPNYLDVAGDGRRELLMAVNPDVNNPDGPDRYMAYLTPNEDPYAVWNIHRVSAAGAPGTTKYAHGLGAGDINGDGRNDVIIPQGWWESPADATMGWKFHEANFGPNCAHMYAYDFDGDGDNDVASSSAHDIGVWWYEQTPDGWKQHVIADNFSQTHSLCMADINSDGLPDLITGKRWWAHGPKGDKEPNAPAVMYWFELQRKDGKAHWVPHQFDDDSGVGTQFEVADVNGDGLLDVVTSNKKGVFYHEQVRE